MFRAVTRPYSHNKQIREAKELRERIQPIIDSSADLHLLQIRLQVAALTHRIDHYQYVQLYINDHAQGKGKQLRTAATGGSNTTDFLPDLIDSNRERAECLIKELETCMSPCSSPMVSPMASSNSKRFGGHPAMLDSPPESPRDAPMSPQRSLKEARPDMLVKTPPSPKEGVGPKILVPGEKAKPG